MKTTMRLTKDRVSQMARRWSNAELRRFAHLFEGDVVNVSAWRDQDKEGRRYRDYFTAARSYAITNFSSDTRGMQGWAEEMFLDLEKPLPADLERRFDVVFNHTTLEHVYECRVAFANLCAMTRDLVVVVVPFLQPYHSECGDFWRFSPLTVQRLFEENSLRSVYMSFNNQLLSSVYIFAIGARDPGRWADTFRDGSATVDPLTGGFIGRRAIPYLSMRNLFDRMRGRAGGAIED
jgi:hypothetical protein